MTWRIHLSNQAIQTLQILPSKPPLLAVWLRPERVQYYDFNKGRLLAEKSIGTPPNAPRSSEAWQDYVGSLTGADTSFYLPSVRLNGLDLYATDDGKLRVYRQADEQLFIEIDGEESPLKLVGAERFVVMDLDRALGTIVGLDEQGKLHIYQQHIRIGTFDLGLKLESDLRPQVAIARGGGNIYASDGQTLVALDASGTILKKQMMHYFIARLACSPSGNMVISSDIEAGVMRVYRGDNLALSHQRFAIDLVAAANQVQLLADLPALGSAVNSLAAYSKGMFAFSMSGLLCISNVEDMDEVPRPKVLL